MRKTAKGVISEAQTGYLEKITKASNELEGHIQKMISISELQAGNLSLKPELLTFHDDLNAITDKWRPLMAEKELTFIVQLPAIPLSVNGDPDRLQWAIDNLLRNAYNYTPPGGTVQFNAQTGLAADGKRSVLKTQATAYEALFGLPGVVGVTGIGQVGHGRT